MVVSGSSKASSWTGGRGTVYLYLFEVFVADDRGVSVLHLLRKMLKSKEKVDFGGTESAGEHFPPTIFLF